MATLSCIHPTPPTLETRGVEVLNPLPQAMGPLSFRRSPANGTRWTPLCFMARGCHLSFDPSHDLASGDAQVLTDRRARVSTDYSPVMILLTVIAALGVLLYSQFLLNPANRGDLLPYSLVIVAETHPDHPRPAVDVDDPVRRQQPARLRLSRGPRR